MHFWCYLFGDKSASVLFKLLFASLPSSYSPSSSSPSPPSSPPTVQKISFVAPTFCDNKRLHAVVYACYNATGHRDLTWKLSHAPNKSMTQEHLSIVKERRRGRKTDEREQLKLTSSFSSNCISIIIIT